MNAFDLSDFKAHLRELTADLDTPLQMALDSAVSEASAFVGFDLLEAYENSIGAPPDVAMAVFTLAQCHADAGDTAQNDARRVAAQRLLLPYRVDCGFGGA